MNKEQHLHAIKVAIIREANHYKGFTLPSPQKTGTSTQQLSYAKQSAEKFYNKYFSKPRLDNSEFIELVSGLADRVVVAQFGGTDKEDDGDGAGSDCRRAAGRVFGL